MQEETPATRPRGRPKAGEAPFALEEILDRALRAFAQDGYAGVSVRTLTRELEVSHSMLHQRFGSKEALWYAAVDHAFSRQAQTVLAFDPTIDDPMDQLALVMRRVLQYISDNPDMLRLMNIEGAIESERLDYIYESYIAPTIAPVVRLLEHLAKEGRIRPVSMETLFFMILHGAAAPFGLVPLATRLGRRDPLSKVNVRRQIDEATEFIINGLRVSGV